MSKISKKIFIVVFVSVLIALSFFREFVFVNINAHMWYLFYENDKSHLANTLSFLTPLSYFQLYWLKWFITILFSGVFLFLSCIIIKLIFTEKKFIHWTIYSYLSIIIISAISYFIGILFNNSEKGYLAARFFMGMLQSPFLLMILIPAFYLEKRGANNESKQISE